MGQAEAIVHDFLPEKLIALFLLLLCNTILGQTLAAPVDCSISISIVRASCERNLCTHVKANCAFAGNHFLKLDTFNRNRLVIDTVKYRQNIDYFDTFRLVSPITTSAANG